MSYISLDEARIEQQIHDAERQEEINMRRNLQDYARAHHFNNSSVTALAPIRYCMGCTEPTTGSIGAAGVYWQNLCQPCKDDADTRLARHCLALSTFSNALELQEML